MDEDIKKYIRNKIIELWEERKGKSFDDRCYEDVKVEEQWHSDLIQNLIIRGVDPLSAQRLFILCLDEVRDEATKAATEAMDRFYQATKSYENDG